MAAYTENRVLDLTKEPGRTGQVRAVTLRRGETGATDIRATVKDDGTAFNVTGYAVKFKVVLPDGKYTAVPAAIVNATSGVVSVTVDSTITAVAGKVSVAYFELTKSGVVLTTDAVPLIILEDMDLMGGAQAAYRNAIDELMDELNKAIASANSAASNANSAATKANTSATSATNAASSATTAATTATQAANSANTAASNATSAATSANTAATKADTAAKGADTAASKANTAATAADGAAAKANQAATDATTATKGANDAADTATKAAAAANAAGERVEDAIRDAEDAVRDTEAAIGEATQAAQRAISAEGVARDAAGTAMDAADAADAAAGRADASAKLAEKTAADVLARADAGEFNGATFIPEVDADCNVRWSNDKGLPNPSPRNIRGPQGTGLNPPKGAFDTYEELQESQPTGEPGDSWMVGGDLYIWTDDGAWLNVGPLGFMAGEMTEADIDRAFEEVRDGWR